jgi:nicotinamidase/pyrazinamidase
MKALILVDLQNDFLPGGALAVPNGDEVLPVAARLIEGGKFPLIVATQDWHPASHGSFASNNPGAKVGTLGKLNGLDQVMWPDHCVQGTKGADFADGAVKEAVRSGRVKRVFQKGTDVSVDSYSGFFDNGRRKSTGLTDYLKEMGVTEVVVLGLATDYCVKFTALDAVTEGFRTTFVRDGSRAVNLSPDDESKAISEMKEKGVRIVLSHEEM